MVEVVEELVGFLDGAVLVIVVFFQQKSQVVVACGKKGTPINSFSTPLPGLKRVSTERNLTQCTKVSRLSQRRNSAVAHTDRRMFASPLSSA